MKRDEQKLRLAAKVECQICGSRLDLQRHHICPRAITQCDDPENIAVLCGTCHDRVEMDEIDIGIYLHPAQAAKVVLLCKTLWAAFMLCYPSESPKRAA